MGGHQKSGEGLGCFDQVWKMIGSRRETEEHPEQRMKENDNKRRRVGLVTKRIGLSE